MKIKEGTIAIKKCKACKKVKECEYGPDPYTEDVLRDSSPLWECQDCRRESSADI